MRTTLDLPDPLFRELKTHASRHGVKMKDLLATFVAEGLRDGKGVRPCASVPRSPLPVARRATGHVIPALDNSQIAEILHSEDAHGRD